MEFSITEMLVIGLVALMLYGGRLPKVALAVGRAIGELKKGLRETSDMVRLETEDGAPAIPRRSTRRAVLAHEGEEQDDPIADAGLATEDITLSEEPGEAEQPAAEKTETETG